jgi:hypothetical protein
VPPVPNGHLRGDRLDNLPVAGRPDGTHRFRRDLCGRASFSLSRVGSASTATTVPWVAAPAPPEMRGPGHIPHVAVRPIWLGWMGRRVQRNAPAEKVARCRSRPCRTGRWLRAIGDFRGLSDRSRGVSGTRSQACSSSRSGSEVSFRSSTPRRMRLECVALDLLATISLARHRCGVGSRGLDVVGKGRVMLDPEAVAAERFKVESRELMRGHRDLAARLKRVDAEFDCSPEQRRGEELQAERVRITGLLLQNQARMRACWDRSRQRGAAIGQGGH